MNSPRIRHGLRASRYLVSATIVAVLMARSPSPVRATSLIALSDDDLVAISSRIVEGTVTNVNSFWTGAHDEIHTSVSISVIQMIKGTAPPSGIVVLQLLGGEVGSDVMELLEQPRFSLGEHVIVFIDNASPPLVSVTGLSQGKFTVSPGPLAAGTLIERRGVTRDSFVRNIGRIAAEQGRGQ